MQATDLMGQNAYQLQRFVDAQDIEGTYEHALSELRAGRKTSHWMWFIFPQIVGLGHSSMARRYAIASIAEAKAYLDHPVLGPRLFECTQALLGLTTKSAWEILGDIDAVKLCSSMTLFAHATSDESVFKRVLDLYFDGKADEETERRL